jgi:1,4-alpha-glucan branching enzyme
MATHPTYRGAMSLVLHAHLPFVRHPEHPSFLEEDWLFEALTETYVPLVRMLDRLEAEGVASPLTLSVSPPLCEMLADPLLRQRYADRLGALIALADAEAIARRGTPFEDGAAYAAWLLRDTLAIWQERYGRDLLAALGRHQDAGRIALVTVAGTHGYLPLMATDAARRAQVEVACANYAKHFGRRPRGIWLPECAYAPGLDRVLADAGISYFFVETHGVSYAQPRPRFAHYRPVLTERGVAAFARDPECSRQVWSAEEGYPGDPLYREFYRDIGWDAAPERVESIFMGGPRRGVGIKLHRVTGKVALDAKEPWVPSWAFERAAEHARHFLASRQAQVTRIADHMGAAPHLLAPFDAELFGHWWFEGVAFIEALFREAATQGVLRMTTPERFLAAEPTAQVVALCASSWGDGGSYEVWLNGGNAWMYQHLHRAEEHMIALADRFRSPSALERRALCQAARELLLAQASDWAFIVTMATVVPYAVRRTRDHLARFDGLYHALMDGAVDEARLAEIEARDTAFQEVDPTQWRSDRVRHPGAGAAVWSVSTD